MLKGRGEGDGEVTFLPASQPLNQPESEHCWKAKRVDLLIPPACQEIYRYLLRQPATGRKILDLTQCVFMCVCVFGCVCVCSNKLASRKQTMSIFVFTFGFYLCDRRSNATTGNMLPERQSAVIIIVMGCKRTDEEMGSEIRRKRPRTHSAVHLSQTHADSPVLWHHKMTSSPFSCDRKCQTQSWTDAMATEQAPLTVRFSLKCWKGQVSGPWIKTNVWKTTAPKAKQQDQTINEP